MAQLSSTAVGLKTDEASTLDFRCNVCGTEVKACPVPEIDREVPSCPTCGSTVRVRSVVHLLSVALFGTSMPIPDWPISRRIKGIGVRSVVHLLSVALFGKSMAIPDWPISRRIKGIGLSDSPSYATRLPAKLDYTNTYFHTEPFLDICNPPEDYANTFDFLISTEVFEHVPPPPQRAFDAAFEMLKPGGAFVFTVPFTNNPDTKEHFPDLHRYQIVKIDDEYVLVNKRRDGEYELHKDLTFHGGPGETLEMRVYSRAALMRHLQRAGFVDIDVMEEPCLEMGIIHNHSWSLPILARKPG